MDSSEKIRVVGRTHCKLKAKLRRKFSEPPLMLRCKVETVRTLAPYMAVWLRFPCHQLQYKGLTQQEITKFVGTCDTRYSTGSTIWADGSVSSELRYNAEGVRIAVSIIL